jgi:hypothetical protein
MIRDRHILRLGIYADARNDSEGFFFYVKRSECSLKPSKQCKLEGFP